MQGQIFDRGTIERRQSLAASSGRSYSSHHGSNRRPRVVSQDGSTEAPQASAGLLSSPAMPNIPPGSLYRGGRPYLLLDSSHRHSLGWQDDRKSGPSFVVVRLTRLDGVKVQQRFPLTEQGWAAAWQALSGLDAGAAAAIAGRLAQLEAGGRAVAALGALDAESVRCLRSVTFNGGAGEAQLTRGQTYDLRFLPDRLMVCLPRSAAALVEVPYRDVETVEVSGPSPGKSAAEVAPWVVGLGLLGALLGLVLFGLLGLLLGAVLFGLVGLLAGISSSKIETIIRLRARAGEFYFLLAGKRADAVRIELAEPLRAIENAGGRHAPDPAELTDLAPGSIPDQLTKLASLLQQSLITRDEFDDLKAKLIPKS
jgi:hypothetical protein